MSEVVDECKKNQDIKDVLEIIFDSNSLADLVQPLGEYAEPYYEKIQFKLEKMVMDELD